MCNKLVEWATEQNLGHSEKHVLTVLAHITNHKTRLCCPGISLIAHKTSRDKRTVMRSLKKLSESGHIKIKKEHGKGNKYEFPAFEMPI